MFDMLESLNLCKHMLSFDNVYWLIQLGTIRNKVLRDVEER